MLVSLSIKSPIWESCLALGLVLLELLPFRARGKDGDTDARYAATYSAFWRASHTKNNEYWFRKYWLLYTAKIHYAAQCTAVSLLRQTPSAKGWHNCRLSDSDWHAARRIYIEFWKILLMILLFFATVYHSWCCHDQFIDIDWMDIDAISISVEYKAKPTKMPGTIFDWHAAVYSLIMINDSVIGALLYNSISLPICHPIHINLVSQMPLAGLKTQIGYAGLNGHGKFYIWYRFSTAYRRHIFYPWLDVIAALLNRRITPWLTKHALRTIYFSIIPPRAFFILFLIYVVTSISPMRFKWITTLKFDTRNMMHHLRHHSEYATLSTRSRSYNLPSFLEYFDIAISTCYHFSLYYREFIDINFISRWSYWHASKIF